MGRKPIEKTCCACLTKGLHFNKVSLKDEDNVSLFTKLKTCVKEVEWAASYYICVECTPLLNTVYAFWKICLNSDYIRRGQQEEVTADTNGHKEENLPGQPLSNTIKDDHVIEGEIQDNLKDDDRDEDCNEEIYTEGYDIKDQPYCSESDQENDNTQSDCEDQNYTRRKRKKLRKQEQHKEKVDKPRKRREKLKFECDRCQSNFSTSTKIVEHCIKEHGMNIKEVKPFACDRCPQRFSTSSNLWQHIKYHDGIKSNMCSYCGKGFVTKTDLINHEKKHLNMREYKCEACGKSFNTHKDIRSHNLIVHTDSSKWKYICEICNKPFPIKSNYDSHMRRHTGDKKFACHLCDKKFTAKCDLQRHTRSHSHVREHRCQHCEKEYKDERVLKVHMAKIHGIGLGKVKIPVRERKYACHFCPKAYYAKNKLTRHLYTHSGEKPFNCPICEKKFNDKSYVKQHLKNTHNVEYQDTLENELKINYMNSSGPDVGIV